MHPKYINWGSCKRFPNSILKSFPTSFLICNRRQKRSQSWSCFTLNLHGTMFMQTRILNEKCAITVLEDGVLFLNFWLDGWDLMRGAGWQLLLWIGDKLVSLMHSIGISMNIMGTAISLYILHFWRTVRNRFKRRVTHSSSRCKHHIRYYETMIKISHALSYINYI